MNYTDRLKSKTILILQFVIIIIIVLSIRNYIKNKNNKSNEGFATPSVPYLILKNKSEESYNLEFKSNNENSYSYNCLLKINALFDKKDDDNNVVKDTKGNAIKELKYLMFDTNSLPNIINSIQINKGGEEYYIILYSGKYLDGNFLIFDTSQIKQTGTGNTAKTLINTTIFSKLETLNIKSIKIIKKSSTKDSVVKYLQLIATENNKIFLSNFVSTQKYYLVLSIDLRPVEIKLSVSTADQKIKDEIEVRKPPNFLEEYTNLKSFLTINPSITGINYIIFPGDLPLQNGNPFKYNQKDYRNIKLKLYFKNGSKKTYLHNSDIRDSSEMPIKQHPNIQMTHYDVLANFSNVDTSKAKEVLDTNIRELSKLEYYIDKMIDSRYENQNKRMDKEEKLEDKMINQVLKKIKENHNEINHQRLTRLQ